MLVRTMRASWCPQRSDSSHVSRLMKFLYLCTGMEIQRCELEPSQLTCMSTSCIRSRCDPNSMLQTTGVPFSVLPVER